MRLTDLARVVGGTVVGDDAEVDGITINSRSVRAGDLFVAMPGTRTHGRAYAADALERGAAAVCDEQPVPGTPTLVVTDLQKALAPLSATLCGHPARELSLIGVTGTIGKTSTSMLIQAALRATGEDAGIVGSVGIRIGSDVFDTGMTTPEADTLHAAFRRMRDQGVRVVAMEVTSHAIELGRVDGLEFSLGVFTNLVIGEHLDFHGTAENYIRTKLRFLDMLAPGAPLVVNCDDDRVRGHTEGLGRPVIKVSESGASGAQVVVEHLRVDAGGSTFTVVVREPLPFLGGSGTVGPVEIPLVVPIFGVQQVCNAAMAAAAALMAGATPEGVTEAVAEMNQIPRRMEVISGAAPLVIDDTAGNPASFDGIFRSLKLLPPPRRDLHVVIGIRGSRGTDINRRLAVGIAEKMQEWEGSVTVTSSEDVVDARDRVLPEEREAFFHALEERNTPFSFEHTVAGAVRHALDAAGTEGMVLLIGPQGMEGGADMVRDLLEQRVAN